MSKEQEFAKSICSRLDEGTRQINGIALKRLESARMAALAQVRAVESERIIVAHASQQASQQGSAATLRLHGSAGGNDGHRHHYLRALFVGLALLAVMAGTAYWQQSNDDEGDDQGLLDAKMLSSELPLYSFLHPDFKEWVESSR